MTGPRPGAPAAPGPLVSFRGVTLGYGGRALLSGLNFEIRAGDFLGIVGPNGSGKTTILRGILGLLRPMAGEIAFRRTGGGPVHVGYVPQRQTVDEVFPLSVHDVVVMGRYRRIAPGRRVGDADRAAVRGALAAAGVSDLEARPFRDLSGGQKQRILIARALASEPDLLVLDEPTNGMDLAGEAAVMALLDRLHRERGLTVIMVSHLLGTLANWCRRLGILHEGILETGAVGDLLTTATLERIYGRGAGVATVGSSFVVLPPGESR